MKKSYIKPFTYVYSVNTCAMMCMSPNASLDPSKKVTLGSIEARDRGEYIPQEEQSFGIPQEEQTYGDLW